MNFSQKRAARESIESTADDSVIDGLSNVTTAEDNLDVQLAETSSLDGQLDQLDKDQDTLAADTTRTEGAIDQADEAIANGEEMPEEAIAHAEVAQESIRNRWGIDRQKLARESYRRGRGMTVAAQEGWKETLKDLWKKFIDFCKMVIGKIKDVKAKYLNVGTTAVKRAKAYQNALRSLGKKNKEEISGGWVNKLAIEGSFNPEGSIAIAKDATTGKAKGAIAALSKQADETAIYVAKTAEGGATAAISAKEAVELFGTAATKLKNLPQFENGEGQKLLALPGNAYIQSGSKSLSGGVEFTAVGFMSTGDSVEDKKVATPDASKLSAATAGLSTIGTGFEAILKDFRGFDAEVDKLLAAAEKASEAFDKADEKADHDALSAARQAADQAVRNYQTINRAVGYVANTVISGLSGYIGAGIGAYGKK